MPKYLLVNISFFLMLLLMPFLLKAQTETELKAGYLVRFINQIDWPSSMMAKSEFVIGVASDQATYRVLKEVIEGDGRMIKNRKLRVLHFTRETDMIICPVVYINNNSPIFLSKIFEKYKSASSLLVTEQVGYLEKGSGINFGNFAGTLSYEVNQKDLLQKDLSLDASLLNNAFRVLSPKENPAQASNNTVSTPVVVNAPPVVREEVSKELINTQNELKNLLAMREENIKALNLTKEQEDSMRRVFEEQISVATLRNEQLQEKIRNQVKLDEANKKARQEEQERVAAQQSLTYTILIAVIVLVSSIAALTFYSSRRRKKIIKELQATKNKLNERVLEVNSKNEMLEESAKMMDFKNQQIRTKNEQLTRQTEEIQIKKDELEEQNQKITDSIRYALTIQQAMLPKLEEIQTAFKDVFIIYQPKDIVSGDFYWFSQIGDYTFLAAIDCTGHGVPGAFMSAIGTDLLNEIINERRIFDPAKALELMHLGIYERLNQHDSKNRDGMDVCLCMFEKQTDQLHRVTFAGAKRPLYYTLPDGTFERITGDNKYIGGIMKEDQAFHNQVIELPANTHLYLTTDGYVDTPNPQRRKFGSHRFHQLLQEIAPKTIREQEKILLTQLAEHRSDTELRDDITLIGVTL